VAHIQDRGKDVNPEKRWQARYRDPGGNERTMTFRRKGDAQRWLDEVTADVLTGRYVDPRAGKVTLRTFAEQWLAAQTFDATTRANTTSRLHVHLLPDLGDLELRRIRPSTVQAWLRGRTDVAAPSYVRVMLTNLSSILSAAVADGLIAANPCDSSAVKPPAVERRKVVPWTVAQVQAIGAGHPDRHRAVPSVAAGLGLRQGEVFGLAIEDVDFLRRKVRVRRQLKLVRGRAVFAPPKGGKEREVPLPEVVAVALAEHVRTVEPVEASLPWREVTGDPRTFEVVFTTTKDRPVNRNTYNDRVWKPALVAAGIAPTRDHGMHACRHHYASVLLDGGVSIRALADYLGHADPGFTLRVYSHLMPETEDRARAAIDAAYAAPAERSRNGASS
jgi:integrase